MANLAVPDILQMCRKLGWKIAVAESCTGGLLAAALTEVAGSSDVFERGIVCYSNAAKTAVLGVSNEKLDEFGAVSPEVALEMARGIARTSQADLVISITGVAGPGASENKPEGRVCFALIQGDNPAECLTREFGAIGRDKVRKSSVRCALTMLINTARTAAGQDYDASFRPG